MSVMFVLVPVALAFVALWLVLFGWCVRTGQFDDGAAPSQRVLWDDETTESSRNERP